MLETRIQALYN